MQNLASRLAAVDETAGAALDVIAYFDELARSAAGLEAVVRGAAVLSGVPARLVDPDRHILIRVTPDGVRHPVEQQADPRWRCIPVFAGQSATVWLETDRRGPLVDDMVLERAAMVAGLTITRVRGAAPPPRPDCAVVETLIDVHVPEHVRSAAARSMGLPAGAPARVVAFETGDVAVLTPDAPLPTEGRLGVGPDVPVLHLPRSAAGARTALRFTAAGTAQDPGPRVVHAGDLGALVHLAHAVDAGAAPSDDLGVLLRAAAGAPWLLATATAHVRHASLRATATELFIHHSTLQERLDQAERLLGWRIREPEGRFRLRLVLAERLLSR